VPLFTPVSVPRKVTETVFASAESDIVRPIPTSTASVYHFFVDMNLRLFESTTQVSSRICL
jgi:hypothetical protein